MLTAAILSSDAVSSAQLVPALQQNGTGRSIVEWTIPATKLPNTAESVPDIVMLDLGRGTDALFTFGAHVRRIRPSTGLIAVSAALPPSQQLLLEAMRSGVQDFLPKPVNMDTLKEMLSRSIENLDVQDRP